MLNQIHEKIKIGNHGGVSGMDACFLDMPQDSSCVNILTVAKRVDIQFNSVFYKSIDEDSVFLAVF